MAQRTVIKLVDDLDHKEIEDGGQTVSFSYNGIQYEIDPGEKNAKKFDDALAPFVAAARRTGGRYARGSKSTGTVDLKAVRAWARSNNIEISARGRIPAEVIDQYRAAATNAQPCPLFRTTLPASIDRGLEPDGPCERSSVCGAIAGRCAVATLSSRP